MVKRSRHRPFTAVTRVRFPSESFYIRRRSQVVRQWSATPVSTGSNPVDASARAGEMFQRTFLLFFSAPAGARPKGGKACVLSEKIF